MKLRNKKTGEIKDAYDVLVMKQDDGVLYKYYSLADIKEEWEDYEEPKGYWWVDYDGKVKSFIDLYEWQDKMKEIGNYFETEEEAEKAVEKLKAWKRLKDKGFRFDNFVRNAVYFNLREEHIQDMNVINDLDLLFGGEE